LVLTDARTINPIHQPSRTKEYWTFFVKFVFSSPRQCLKILCGVFVSPLWFDRIEISLKTTSKASISIMATHIT
jgi:hypothetical protein